VSTGPAAEERAAASSTPRWLAPAVLLLGLVVRVPLILAWPAVFGGDSVVRLARSNELFLGYWLPLPQALVMLCRGLHPDPLWTRLAFALIGSLAAAALARAVGAASGPVAGAAAGAFLALHPMWAYYSLVPYQEGPTALFLLLGAEALVRRRPGRAALWLGLACGCRYEAWIAAFLAALAHWRSPRRALSFLVAPALWIALHLGLGPAGSYVLDLDPAAARLHRVAYLFTKLREYSGLPFLALAAAGLVVAALRRDRRWGWGALFVGAVVIVTVLAGHEFPPGSGQVSERMDHLPAAAACAAAGLALGALVGAVRGRARPAAAALAVLVIAGVGWKWNAQLRAQVRTANDDPALRLAWQVATLARGQLGRGEHLAVAGLPIPDDAVEAYVRKVAAGHGQVERALAIARAWSGHSPDLDRVAANLARPAGTAVRAGTAEAALLAVFDDAPQPPPCGTVLARYTSGARGVTVCRPPR